ncbi:DUF2062 domain-containing protein [Lusitaniella coriacea LEGE 07157]|uniref:DUF2062 domain-containing protein n=1 Tax=Lusitaniella coriacea LEGE 07157 TaxID=945747 RepID=A0A8J7DX10_9CYAN|nr:DUF2062 domain-containing protein [Lusitaniella coriacea]MBE9116663.1 DUF2062 domain-containing protein [Lusitaniella coriacea LEGE 07157]
MQRSSPVVEKPVRDRPSPKRNQHSWLRNIRLYYYRLLRLQGSSGAIARGIASGVFAGCFPFFGVQILLGVLLATVVRGNRFAAAAGTWISNPITYVPIFIFNFKIGERLLGLHYTSLSIDEIDWQSAEILDLGLAFLAPLFVGCLVTGSIAAICSYFLSSQLFKRWHQSRRNATRRNREWSDREWLDR